MTEWQIEMRWRCRSCRVQNLGRRTICEACGSPKEGDEPYEMPDDTSRAAQVTDPRLLAIAHGGANWRCRYCGSDQRRADGVCGRCGAAQAEGTDLGAEAPRGRPMAARPARSTTGWLLAAGAAGALVVILGVVAVLVVSRRTAVARPSDPPAPAAWEAPKARDVSAKVTALRWERRVIVERWQLVDAEGFEDQRPEGAKDIRSLGKRVHHTDRVPDGFDTRTVTETVPDGTTTETYQEREACGQDCTTRPPVCRRECKPNKNGFATCNDVCTGGGQDCRTRTCTVTKTRQVPRTKTVTRTVQVPKFRDEPVMREAFGWRQWAWRLDRTVTEEGIDGKPRWPEAQRLTPAAPLLAGQRERERRSSHYEVELTTAEGEALRVRAPSAAALQRFALGSDERVRVEPSGAVSSDRLEGAPPETDEDPTDAGEPATDR